jgi:hypothetical protein
MPKLGDCLFCNGSGRCEECNGRGINPHVSSSDAVCPHCSGSRKCPECDGSGLSPIGRPRKGNVLKYGTLIAALLIGLLALMSVPNRIVAAIAGVVWVGLLYGLFSWNSKRRKSSPPSHF